MKLRCLTVAALLLPLAGCGSKLPINLPPNMERADLIRAQLDTGGAAAATGPVLVEPQGWATLTGTFKVIGTPPAEEPLKPTSDLGVCSPGGKAPVAGTVQVGGDGGLANVLVFLTTTAPADAGDKWEHPDYATDKEASVSHPFDQKNCLFLSRIFPMRSTQTIMVKNSDSVGHNANIQPKSGAKPENLLIPGGQSLPYKPGGFTDAPFPVACSIHPWMKAWMISRPNPYFAVSDSSGAFKIANLPAAAGLKLEFRGWHEKPGYLKEITVDGTPAKWKQGKFLVELEPGATKNLEITIDASLLK
jgi:predicted small lipoprotein YifL